VVKHSSVKVGIINGTEVKPHSRPYMAFVHGQIISLLSSFYFLSFHILLAVGITNLPGWLLSINQIIYKKIILLQLRGTVKKSQTVNWISIPQRDEDIPANLKCSVAGWGKTGDTKNPSYRLMETDVHIIDGAKCKESWGRYPNPRMMCGDSGGPLVCKNTAVGIVSFNQKNNCDSPNVPNVYAKISAFLPWIKSVIGNV
uniref:Peptidase S1 domain-containing protein n=1 Tax=Astyanax mexicanus TaxID=7994 RepID=A0A8B9RLU6_ASTMX